MNYRQNNIKRNILVGIFALMVLVSVSYFWGGTIYYGISAAAHYVSEPLWKAGNRVSNTASSYAGFLDSKGTLKERNDELEKEIQELRLKLLSKDLLLQENKELKAVLGRVTERDVILAAVLSKPNNSPYDTLIIDIGKDKGIEEGDKVLVEGEIVIGTIQEVYAYSSKVELYSSPGLTHNVTLRDGTIPATAYGKGVGNFAITLPRDVEIALGDVVTIPDTEITVLGSVLYIEKDPNSPFQTILVKSPINFSELRW
ncbi:MAG: rod shape-determining protein MreC, partial [Candidatus Yonathbacteria bacterium]|nr:rod shape-determining protein MreC [Candidatus Yonathbacteria bacterium]